MVNGRPFVKNTGISRQVAVKWFAMREVSDKRFYGYLFGQQGELGIVESNEDGGYRFVRMDVRPVDLTRDEIMVLAVLLVLWRRKKDNWRQTALVAGVVALTGLPGVMAYLLLPGSRYE